MHRLFRRPLAGRPVRAAWALEEAGAPYEIADLTLDETRGAAHRARHPLGRVPVLEDDHGLLFESAAICLQVADLHPDAGLIPPPGTPARGVVYQWVLFGMTELEPALLPLLPGRAIDPAAEPAARDVLAERLAVLEPVLERQEHIAGAAFSIADVVVGSLAADIVGLGLADGFPAVTAYAERLEERPARRRAVAVAGVTAGV